MRLLKRVGIALLVFVVVLIIAAAITLWYIFKPEKLTPIVNKQAKDYLTCNTSIEKIEPTLFSTYPFIGVELTNLCLTENTNSPKSDTLLYAAKCYASLNIKSYLFSGAITVNPFLVVDGYLNFKIDSLGHSNFNISTNSSDSTADNSEVSSFEAIDISNVEFKNFNANYTDAETLTTTDVQDLNARLECKYNKEKQHFDLDLQLNRLRYVSSDSMALNIDVKNCDLKVSSKATDKNLFNSNLKLVCSEMAVSMAGEEFVSNIKFDTHIPFNLSISENSFDLKDAKLIVNDEQEVSFGGSVKILNDNSISTNITYSTRELDIEKVIPLVPKTYANLLEDITAKGYAQLNGAVKGVISDTITPIVTANIDCYKNEITYIGFPTVKNIEASMLVKLNMNDDQGSDITITSASGKIENSTVSVKGIISNILDELEYDIYASGEFNISDFESLIPSDLNLIVQGSVDGDLHTRFSQTDVDSEQYHRFNLTGDFNTQNFNAVYSDTITLNLPSAKVKLQLPGQSKGDKNLLFANIKLDAPNLNINLSPEMGTDIQNIELSADVNNFAEGVSAPIT